MAIDDVFIKAFQSHRTQGDLFHHDQRQAHELFQTSTIGALMEGIYDGEVTYGELAKHGDFGLGTFNALDGEMIAFNGRFYQITGDGKARPVSPSAKTPFAVVMFFDPTVKVLWEELTDWDHFQQAVDKAVPSKNIFYAVMATAAFDYIKVRTVPRQQKPYPPLAEVAKRQAVFEHEGVRGTLVGFRFPATASSVNVAGWHFHFIAADGKRCGHVLRLTTGATRAALQELADLRIRFPAHAPAAPASAEAVRSVERPQ